MYKSLLRTTLLMLLILLLCGCQDTSNNENGKDDSSVGGIIDINKLSCIQHGGHPTGTLAAELAGKKNAKSLDELTVHEFGKKTFYASSRVYDKHKVNPRFWIDNYHKNYTPQAQTPSQFHQVCPIEWIQMIDENTAYIVYKFKKLEKAIPLFLTEDDVFYVYVVFRKRELVNERTGELYETWGNQGEYYFVIEELTLADFSEVEIRDQLMEHPKIWNTVGVNLESIPTNNVGRGSKGCFLLKDGFVRLEVKKTQNYRSDDALERFSELRITELEIYPYGEYPGEEYCGFLREGFVPEFPEFSDAADK